MANRRIKEEIFAAPFIHYKSGNERRNRLRAHGSGVVETRIFTRVSRRRQLDDHRESVDVCYYQPEARYQIEYGIQIYRRG